MRGSLPVFTPREVAILADVPLRSVEKSIEEGALAPRFRAGRSGQRPARRMLPAIAVAYCRIVASLDLRLTPLHKKRLIAALSALRLERIDDARIELVPGVELDVGQLAGAAIRRAESYRQAREASIASAPSIKGGIPVIRGTRMTTHSILARVEHGDSLAMIVAENPDISREALEAALIYARAHPLLGRPAAPRAEAA